MRIIIFPFSHICVYYQFQSTKKVIPYDFDLIQISYSLSVVSIYIQIYIYKTQNYFCITSQRAFASMWCSMIRADIYYFCSRGCKYDVTKPFVSAFPGLVGDRKTAKGPICRCVFMNREIRIARMFG